MKLYGYWRSSATWRVRIALAYKGLTYDYQPVHLVKDGGEQRSESYRRLNPMQQVPTLELPDGRRLTQSLAIIDWLEATHPSPALYPADPFLRARALELAQVVNAGIQPLQNLAVLDEMKRLGGDPQAWGRKVIEKGLTAIEQLSKDTRGTFLVGDAVSVADACLIPQLYNARRFGADFNLFPSLAAIEEACMQLDAFQVAHADRQPDAVTS